MLSLDMENEASGDRDLDKINRLADQALAHARRHNSPPLPCVYEVWFAYASGEDPALCDRIDRELSRGERVDLDKIEEIYRDHFLGKRLSERMTAIGDGLELELGTAIDALGEGLGSNRRFLGSLRRAQDRMSDAAQQQETARSVTALVELARAHATQTEILGGELTKVRGQVRELQDELMRLRDTAYLDHLTQLPNRRHLDEVLEREVLYANRTGQPLCIALADLDRFKRLNDTYGHAVGDAVLKLFAGLVRNNVKGQDTAARFGGEEFAIVFPRTSLLNGTRLADRIRRQLAEADFVLGSEGRSVGEITASFGVTQLIPGETVAELIQRADTLLYSAKRLGRNRVEAGL